MTKHEGHPEYRELGAYTAPAAPVQGEEHGPTGIEAANIVTDYLRLRCENCDEGDAANIIHMLYENGVRFRRPIRQTAGQWRAIETAPKDGTIVLGGHLFQGRWIYRLAKWNECHRAFNHYPNYHVSPSTHWMPLPTPPQTQVGDNLTGASTSDDGNCPQLDPFPAESGAYTA